MVTADALNAVPAELRTDRLLLRRADPADARALVDAVNASLPELQRWINRLPMPLRRVIRFLTSPAPAALGKPFIQQ